ncbi:MAG TPA: heat-inducible transcriptional repressor HrcA [Actinomycetota bacterium]
MSLDERKALLLRAVVHDFIQTAEPVGSKALSERYTLGVSPATIRNELAVLEAEGYLSHPHTSAGRVPTERGYRFYVDSLSGVNDLAHAQEEAVVRYLTGTAGLEEILQRTSLLLATLTRYTAMVTTPAIDNARLRHVELVLLSPHVVLMVLIVDTGQVSKRIIESASEVTNEDLDELRRQLNDKLVRERLSRAELALSGMAPQVRPERRGLFAVLADAIGQLASDRSTERVWVGGQAHIAGPGVFDGLDTIRRVYEALEQQVLLLRLLEATMRTSDHQLSVVIGSENKVEGMEAVSLVTATYPAGDTTGTIGVLGPTRMDYLRAMAAVQAVASYLGAVLDDVER